MNSYKGIAVLNLETHYILILNFNPAVDKTALRCRRLSQQHMGFQQQKVTDGFPFSPNRLANKPYSCIQVTSSYLIQNNNRIPKSRPYYPDITTAVWTYKLADRKNLTICLSQTGRCFEGAHHNQSQHHEHVVDEGDVHLAKHVVRGVVDMETRKEALSNGLEHNAANCSNQCLHATTAVIILEATELCIFALRPASYNNAH